MTEYREETIITDTKRWWDQEGMVFPGRTVEGGRGGYGGGESEEVGNREEREDKMKGIM